MPRRMFGGRWSMITSPTMTVSGRASRRQDMTANALGKPTDEKASNPGERTRHNDSGAWRVCHDRLAARAIGLFGGQARRGRRAPDTLARAGAGAAVRERVALRVHGARVGGRDPHAAPELVAVQRTVGIALGACHGRLAEAARRVARARVAVVHRVPVLDVLRRRQRRAVGRSRRHLFAHPGLGGRRRGRCERKQAQAAPEEQPEHG